MNGRKGMDWDDDYWENTVRVLDISEDEIGADVLETEVYNVKISLENGGVADMACSCLYAEQDRNCRHMAVACVCAFQEAESQRRS